MLPAGWYKTHQTTSQVTDYVDEFTQFQLKEYENISQAHFKTNEVLATFYRYFLLIAAIPITALGIALINLTDDGIGVEGRFLAQIIFGVSTLLLSLVGAAVIAYIEGLRLDAILYARVVNSIRNYFFKLPGAEKFGNPVLPIDKFKPSYGGFGSSFLMYFACAMMNSFYASAGVFALMIDASKPLTKIDFACGQWVGIISLFLFTMIIQALIRRKLLNNKLERGF